jgi:hypothetical protein
VSTIGGANLVTDMAIGAVAPGLKSAKSWPERTAHARDRFLLDGRNGFRETTPIVSICVKAGDELIDKRGYGLSAHL